jgi:hypothetical protein
MFPRFAGCMKWWARRTIWSRRGDAYFAQGGNAVDAGVATVLAAVTEQAASGWAAKFPS